MLGVIHRLRGVLADLSPLVRGWPSGGLCLGLPAGLSLVLLAANPKERARGDLKRGADVVNRKAVAVERGRLGSLFLIKLGFAASRSAAGPGCRSSSCGPFLDEVAVGLAQGGEEVGQRFARTGGGVDVLIEAAKADPSTAELLDRPDQMAKASTQPVESPHHESVPFAKQRECQLQLWELRLASARHVGKEPVDACLVESLFLKLKALLAGRDPGVSDERAHLLLFLKAAGGMAAT